MEMVKLDDIIVGERVYTGLFVEMYSKFYKCDEEFSVKFFFLSDVPKAFDRERWQVNHLIPCMVTSGVMNVATRRDRRKLKRGFWMANGTNIDVRLRRGKGKILKTTQQGFDVWKGVKDDKIKQVGIGNLGFGCHYGNC